MTTRLTVFLILLVGQALGQQGIVFEQGTSWAAIKAKAKAENKFIFMDCVTTWCVPCKEMSMKVFPTQEAGDFFNANFINVKVQMDQSAQDDAETVDWYEDAERLAADYQVVAYPTFLYFNPDGELVHRVVGARDLHTFIAQSAEALTPTLQYHTRVRAFEEAGKKTTEGYRSLAIAARAVFDGRRANQYATRYLELAEDPFTPEWLEFAQVFNTSSRDSLFSVFMENPSKIDRIMGNGFTARHVEAIILREEIYPVVPPSDTPDWAELETRVATRYPTYAASAIAKFKTLFYLRSADWQRFEQAVDDYLASYLSHTSASDLYQFAVAFYEAAVYDKALVLLESAIATADDTMQKTYRDTLDKWKENSTFVKESKRPVN